MESYVALLFTSHLHISSWTTDGEEINIIHW